MKTSTNKNGFIHSAILVILIFVLLLVGAIYFFQPVPKSVNVPAPTVTNTNNLKTYKNEQYGFEINYSDAVILYEPKDFEKMTNLSYIPVCDRETALACFYYPGNEFRQTNFSGAGLSINLVKDSNSQEKCDNFVNPGHVVVMPKQINGLGFWEITRGGAASGNQRVDRVDRVFVNKNCFEVISRIVTDASDVNLPMGQRKTTFSENDKAKVIGIFDRILSTLNFSGEILLLPQLNVSKTGWETHKGEKFTILASSVWSSILEKRDYGITLDLTKNNGEVLRSGMKIPQIIIGDGTVFSTSGAVCGNATYGECEDAGSIKVSINNLDLVARIIKKMQFTQQGKLIDPYYVSQLSDERLPLGTITIIFKTKDEGQEIANILSTISLPESYISCGCGCCGSDKPFEEITKAQCLYRSKGEDIQNKINQDKKLSPELCATMGCSFPIKYVYCD